ncbi:4099_t:CDS:2 [Diversispora eburnea]|uniref:4099_t:CDS:1 n=1 Tax=Diversispora eburnea TaxID=1213867 RepID=A0A9N8ZNS3_9GLOM|nr:4099_t:CDS:2 [Diversispora eburnea]
MPLDRYNRRFARSVSPLTTAVSPYYRRRSSSVPSGATSPASSTAASFTSNTASFVPSVTTTYYCSYYYDPSRSYAIPDFANSLYFTPSTYVSPASSVTLPSSSSVTLSSSSSTTLPISSITNILPTYVSPASSTAASSTSSTATSSASSITTISPTYVSSTSSTAASSASSDTTTSFSSSLTPSYASVSINTSSAPTFFATNYSNSVNSFTTTTVLPTYASTTALLTAASSNTTTSSPSSLTPSYASVSANSSSAPTFFAINFSNSANSSITTTNFTFPSTSFATNHLNTSLFAQASPTSSRENSVTPGNRASRYDSTSAIRRHDAVKSTLTSTDIELSPPVVVNRAQLSVIRNQRRINNRYTPYIGSSLNDRGVQNHLEMAEDVCKHYIPKPATSLHLWNRPSRADRVALRKNNTGIKFRDGFIKHARSPASRKPCYNNPFEQYQIERSERDDQIYEEAEWETIGEERSVFSNPNLTSSQFLENCRSRLNFGGSRNVTTPN